MANRKWHGTAATICGTASLLFTGLQSTTGAGCPVDGIPMFSDVFAEDTIANSAYNAFEAMLEKRFSHGLQFQASYTFSKSLDDGSTFEETLNPFNFKASRGLSLFNSKQRFVISYDWELPLGKASGGYGRAHERLGYLGHYSISERLSHPPGQ
jgi:hypothetical protein